MINLTDAARRCLDDYLAKVRSSLRHCPSVDVADIERDVIEHIEHALTGASGPVDAAELQDVLRDLGSPAQWVPQDELSWHQRAPAALESGPDDLRLGYIAFGLLAGTLLAAACLNLMVSFGNTLPFLLLGIAASFLFARASLSAEGGAGQAERWLIYPCLIVVYVPVTALILMIPLVAAITTEVILTDPGTNVSILSWARSSPMGTITAFALLTLGSIWVAVIGFVAWRWPAAVRNSYAPFARGFRRRGFLLSLSILGLLTFLGCATVWVATVRRHLDEASRYHPVASPAPNSSAPSRSLPSGNGSRPF